MDLASDGRTLYQAVASGSHVFVNGRSTEDAPGPLMGERVAVSPVGSIAVVARIGSGPLKDRAYACRMGQPWYELGPSAQLQGIAWIGGQFVCARVGPGGSSLVEQTIEGSILGTDVANTSQGILYYDDLDSRWIIQSQAVTKVGKYQMLKAIRRKLPDGRIVACGQVTNPDRIVIASFDGSIAFQAGEQINTPVFVTVGSQLACLVKNNALKTFDPPYPKVDLPAPPPPPPPPEPPMPPTIPNHKSTVERWRKFYDHLPPGSERAFRVSNGTAWDHREEGAGILSKPSGHNFNGYATDIVVYKDGRHFDVLVDGEGEARPTWRLITNPPTVDPARWRAPINPNMTPGPDPEPPPPPPPTPNPPPPSNQHCWVASDALFHRSLALQDRCAAKWRALHVPPGTPGGHMWLDPGQCHLWMYRFFVEGRSEQDIENNVT